jgi:hypothetical protein
MALNALGTLRLQVRRAGQRTSTDRQGPSQRRLLLEGSPGRAMTVRRSVFRLFSATEALRMVASGPDATGRPLGSCEGVGEHSPGAISESPEADPPRRGSLYFGIGESVLTGHPDLGAPDVTPDVPGGPRWSADYPSLASLKEPAKVGVLGSAGEAYVDGSPDLGLRESSHARAYRRRAAIARNTPSHPGITEGPRNLIPALPFVI